MPQDINDNIDKVQEVMTDVTISEIYSHSTFLAGIICGVILTLLYHRFVGRKFLVTSYEKLIKAKDETIKGYSVIISERLAKVSVSDEGSKSIIKNLKKYFKKKN